jgi:pyridoxal phosphate enzyme (YggS family)
MGAVAENLVRGRAAMAAAAARAGRDPASVRLIAVSKTQPVRLIEEALAAGQHHFGENYAQELREKMAALPAAELRWHFIGALQRNKVKYLVGKVDAVHSLDGLELAHELEKRSANAGVVTRVLVEVNLGGEASKSGVTPTAASALVRSVRGLPHLELVGLMTMPPWTKDPEAARPFFRALRELRDRLRAELDEPAALPELSMGLSHDFEVAIEEGATMVRVGTAIFGERIYGK